MKAKLPSKRSNQARKSNVKLNPFEVHINKSKHQVLGRKLKSDKGMPGISRHKAFKKRKDTLLQEYKMRHKSNHFVDQRIGERNSEMTEDDRIMARFTAERMRMFNKKTMFNLSDSEVLTHRGQTLSEIERFEDTRSDDDEDDPGSSGALKRKFVGDAHFGGGILTKNKQDRESLIDELINESKKRKAERQRNKDETLEATEKLDEEWKILGQITTSFGLQDAEPDRPIKTKDDNYDVVMRQLKFEPQGQASQRLKTDEEIAKEDKEKLEKLEHERLKQLREIEANRFGNHRSSDDIDDGFSNLTNEFPADDENDGDTSDSPSESFKEKNNFDHNKSVLNAEKESESDSHGSLENKGNISDDSNDGNNGSGLDCENDPSSDGEPTDESSDEECAMDNLTDLMPSLTQEIESYKSSQKLVTEVNNFNNKTAKLSNESLEAPYSSSDTISVDLDLPYVLNVPDNFESFKDLLNNHSSKQQNIIFERLLKSNHPTLEPGNKKKILKLAEYIIQFVNEEECTLDALPNMIIHFNIFKEYNKEECLKMLVDTLSMKLNDFDPSQQSIKFIMWYVLLFLKPQGMDVLLPINKPALSLIAHVVSQADVLSKPKVTLSLLCCYLLLQDAKSSSTVYTDAIVFLQNCFINYTSENNESCKKSKFQKKSNCGNKTKPSVDKTENSNVDEDLKLNLVDLVENDENFSNKVVYVSAILLTDFVKTYRKYPQSKIMFQKVYNVITHIKTDIFAAPLNKTVEELRSLLEILNTALLTPVIKAAKKPKALRQYEPSFHTITEGKRSLRGLPAEKQEEQKLLHKYKTEMKGAMRELRRDRVFLANVKLSEKAQSDAERIKKVKEIFGAASAQQGELRSLKRKK